MQSSWDPFGSTGKCCLRLCLDFLTKRAAQAQLQVLQVHQWQDSFSTYTHRRLANALTQPCLPLPPLTSRAAGARTMSSSGHRRLQKQDSSARISYFPCKARKKERSLSSNQATTGVFVCPTPYSLDAG